VSRAQGGAALFVFSQSMIPKSGDRFSDKVMLNQNSMTSGKLEPIFGQVMRKQ
jgi:hypothetical protein